MTPSIKTVALLSGGLDSTVALAKTLADAPDSVVLALSIDYGQRPVEQELKAASAIAAHYQLPHKVIRLDWLASLLPHGLSQHGASHAEGKLGVTDVWVPNRNGVLLNIAAAFAEARQARQVIFGANLEEAEAGFPDNSAPYWEKLNQALQLSTLNQVQVEAPVGHLEKAAIVAMGLELEAPLGLVWSCYEGEDEHCGQCASCQLLYKATQANGVTLPQLSHLTALA